MMEESPKLCPFCLSHATLLKTRRATSGVLYAVECSYCGGRSSLERTRTLALEIWQRIHHYRMRGEKAREEDLREICESIKPLLTKLAEY